MAHRMQLQYSSFDYYDLTNSEPGPCRSCTNNNSPSNELNWLSCISYRITVLIHVVSRGHVINNWINEQFAVSLCRNIYTHMHGLIFDTSIWLLAGSTRFASRSKYRVVGNSVIVSERTLGSTSISFAVAASKAHDCWPFASPCNSSMQSMCGYTHYMTQQHCVLLSETLSRDRYAEASLHTRSNTEFSLSM